MYTLQWSKKAFKQLSKVPTEDQQRIYRRSQELADFSTCLGVKKLTNHPYDYRLRVGRYRVLFTVDSDVKIIGIEEVKKRDESTY